MEGRGVSSATLRCQLCWVCHVTYSSWVRHRGKIREERKWAKIVRYFFVLIEGKDVGRCAKHNATQHYTLRYTTLQYTTQHITTHHTTPQYNTTPHSSTQHNTTHWKAVMRLSCCINIVIFTLFLTCNISGKINLELSKLFSLNAPYLVFIFWFYRLN